VLVALSLCLGICSVHGATNPSISNICDFEELPEGLPTNLSSVAYLGTNGEFHLHGDYYANFTAHDHHVFFTLKEESYFRISVAPQQDWDVDLFLYSQAIQSPIASAVAFYGEELITRTLPAGDYRLKFSFLSTRPPQSTIFI
jgi:hypothetical protein